MSKKQVEDTDDLLPEYDLDYSKARPNHFASRVKRNTVVLDDDVARVFVNSEAVNRVLRALIQSLSLLPEQKETERMTVDAK